MDKRISYLGKTETGVYCQSLFGSAGAFEKTAGAPPFADWATGEQIRTYISGITAADRKKSLYVLVNALGAGEYFGSNINADYFPWAGLANDTEAYGYKTFLQGHAFQHHKNKDPNIAFGVPVLSVLNHPMKRVELIIRLDREKARAEGAGSIITRIEGGEFPDVSMGCKVPFDVCSICGNKSRTRVDYCQHMYPEPELRHMYGPNKILPDGRKIFVYNHQPRFFDISFVFIGADKTAKTMAKLASKGASLCMGDVCAVPTSKDALVSVGNERKETPEVGLQKVASAEPCCDDCGDDQLAQAFGVQKTSSQLKYSEIIKSVPAGSAAMKRTTSSEPTLPPEVLEALARESMGGVCTTTGMLGMVLKPQEFQRIVLVKMGEAKLADELDARGQHFREVGEVDGSVAVAQEYFNRDLAEGLLEHVEGRSAFGSHLPRRMVKAAGAKKILPTGSAIEHPLLDKISAAYNGYRHNLLMKLSQAVEVIQSDPKLREAVLGNELTNLFSKTASTPVVTHDSIRYFSGAHFSDRGLLTNTDVAKAASVNNEWILPKDHDPA